MANALAGFERNVSGTIEHGRAFLRGDVAADADRQAIERSVLELHCVTDVINDIAVRPLEPARSWAAAPATSPVIFLTSYCTLQQDCLTSAIEGALSILIGELHGSDGPLADKAIVFYYGWHGDAALIDIAIPATDALLRRRDNEVRASVVPASKHCILPAGGISGLRSARRRLRLAAGVEVSDQLFRVWQCVPLDQGKLSEAWLSAPVYCAE
ncbi:MAG: BON domain-containing protein [Devosia sp.]